MSNSEYYASEEAAAPPAPRSQGETSAARTLEMAARTADQLVADAKAEAEALVNEARANADQTAQASRDEADRAAAELDRARSEQAAELDRERTSVLSGLTDEKAALEAEIASLRQKESEQRNQMRRLLSEQLASIDKMDVEPPEPTHP